MEVWNLVKRIAQGVIRRRKRLAVFVFLGALIVSAPVAYVMSKEPPRYRTTATILLEAKPDRVPLFQEFSPFRPLPVQLAILRSRSLAEAVIDNLPKSSFLDLVENPYHIDYELEVKNAYRRFRGREPEVQSPQRRALAELQNARVRFATRGNTGIIDVSAEASKPQASVDLVNTYVEVLLARTRTFNLDDARVSREFLEQQLADVKKNMHANDEALRAFTHSHGGVRVPDRSQATIARLSQTEASLAEVETNRKMVQTRLSGLREKVENQKRSAPPPSSATVAPAPAPPPMPLALPPSVQRLRDQLVQLEKSLLDLRTKYTDEHPRVVLIKDRIGEIQRQLAGVVKETVASTPSPAAVPPAERVNFSEQVVALETSLHSLSAQEEALRRQADNLRQSLSGLSRSELEYTRLTRDADSTRNLHAMISDKLTAARIREQGEMKVVKVIDPPAPATQVPSTKPFKFFAAALLGSFAISAGIPVAAEILNKTVETEADVTAATGLPVLAVIPRVRAVRPILSMLPESNAKQGADEQFMFTEAFRTLRVATQFAIRADNMRTLLVASPFPGEGKSTTVVNLGLAFSEAGWRVVLADTDFARPTLTKMVKVPHQRPTGLLEVLNAKRSVEEALTPVSDGMWLAAQTTALQARSRGLLAPDKLTAMVGDMSAHADLVICDSSPTLLVPESLFLAGAVDGVILVAKAGSTGCRDLAQAKAALENAGAKIVGVVINEVPASALKGYYSRYYNAYVRSPKR